MTLDLNNFDRESKWIDDIRPDLSNLSWEQCLQANKLNNTLKNLSTATFDDLKAEEQKKIRALSGKISKIDAGLKNYKPSFCRIIWEIITLSFKWFKARRLQKTVPKLLAKLKKISPISSKAPSPTSPGVSSAPKDSKTDGSSKPKVPNEIIDRKVAIVKKALELIEGEAKSDTMISVATTTAMAVKRFFEDKLKVLESGENTVIGGSFYHCTGKIGGIKKEYNAVLGMNVQKPEGVVGIISSQILKGGETNAYGFGVYASTTPEYSMYGNYCFAFDDRVDELTDKNGRALVERVLFTNQGDRLWVVFQGAIPINKDTCYLCAPDTDVEKADKYSPQRYRFKDDVIGAGVGVIATSEIDILPRSVFDNVRKYIIRAEDLLNTVRLPKKAFWHRDYNRTNIDRYKTLCSTLTKWTGKTSSKEIK